MTTTTDTTTTDSATEAKRVRCRVLRVRIERYRRTIAQLDREGSRSDLFELVSDALERAEAELDALWGSL